MAAATIELQPKQSALLKLIKTSSAVVIGAGGGRGSAKSSGADRCVVTLMHEWPGLTACMIMRTWVKQLVPYHLEPIRRDFPWVANKLKSSPPAMLRIGKSRLDFKYAENYDAVIEAFRSGNYDLLLIDQAEQFSAREIREMRKACRSTGGRTAKTVLIFNMRGASIQDLRKWFHLHEVNKDEDPADYVFLKMNPWDNVEWVRGPLKDHGYTVKDYYSWTDQERKVYAAKYGAYTRQLATDDAVIRKADWDGDWDSLEGAYFANSFELESVRCNRGMVELLRNARAAHWIAQDWGKAHWCVTLWAFRVTLRPSEALQLLEWQLDKPINVTVIYREMVINETEAPEVAQEIVNGTPEAERKLIKAYYLSPEEVTDDANCIGIQQSRRMRLNGMPGPVKADNDRKGGYGLMGALFKATKGKGWGIDVDGNRFQYDDAILISSECAELLNAIPALVRDPKNLDDVLKTDLSTAKVEQDLGDSARYLLKSMLSPRKMSRDELLAEEIAALQKVDPMEAHFLRARETERRQNDGQPLQYWE